MFGDFGVYAKDLSESKVNKGVWWADDFYIGEKKKVVSDLVSDGYPFFAGNITLKKKFYCQDKQCVLNIKGKYGYAEISVNGKRAEKSYFDNKVDVSNLVEIGENLLEVTLYTSNKNLLGPHHNIGEDFTWASPGIYELAVSENRGGKYLFTERTICKE